MSMKESSDAIGNRTRDLPTCSAVPQPTAPPRALIRDVVTYNSIKHVVFLDGNLTAYLKISCLNSYFFFHLLEAKNCYEIRNSPSFPTVNIG